MSSTDRGSELASTIDVVTIGGFLTRYLAASIDRDGAYALVEHELAPGLIGAPPHRHSREDECSYVIEGSLTMWRAGTVVTLEAGEVGAKPRGEWHTFWNAGPAPVRFLEVIAPGAFADYFRELGALFARAESSGAPPDFEAIASLAGRYGLEFDFATMGTLLVEHGLRVG